MWHLGRGTNLLDPTNILERVGVRSGWHVGDMGCGSLGHFVFPAAHLVGGEGRVYAVDIQRAALQAIQSAARAHQVWNVHPVWADLEVSEATPIRDESLDLTLISNTLYLASNRQGMINEVMRLLKPGGLLLVIEWKKEPTVLGPSLEERLSGDDIFGHLSGHPIPWMDQFEAGDHHQAFLFQKGYPEIIVPQILSMHAPSFEA